MRGEGGRLERTCRSFRVRGVLQGHPRPHGLCGGSYQGGRDHYYRRRRHSDVRGQVQHGGQGVPRVHGRWPSLELLEGKLLPGVAALSPLPAQPRRFFVGGNWKMNGTKAEIDTIVSWMTKGPLDPNTEVVVAVPQCYQIYARQKLPSAIGVAAQNCYKAAKGAFTGEQSPQMVLDCGAKWAVLGHSERRNVFGETDQLIGEKVGFALQSGLNVIPCFGEKLEEREAGRTMEVETLSFDPLDPYMEVCFQQLSAI